MHKIITLDELFNIIDSNTSKQLKTSKKALKSIIQSYMKSLSYFMTRDIPNITDLYLFQIKTNTRDIKKNERKMDLIIPPQQVSLDISTNAFKIDGKQDIIEVLRSSQYYKYYNKKFNLHVIIPKDNDKRIRKLEKRIKSN